MITKTIEAKIRETMRDKGISEAFVAKQIAIKKDDFILSLNGKRKLKISEFLNICTVLGLDLEDFSEEVI